MYPLSSIRGLNFPFVIMQLHFHALSMIWGICVLVTIFNLQIADTTSICHCLGLGHETMAWVVSVYIHMEYGSKST